MVKRSQVRDEALHASGLSTSHASKRTHAAHGRAGHVRFLTVGHLSSPFSRLGASSVELSLRVRHAYILDEKAQLCREFIATYVRNIHLRRNKESVQLRVESTRTSCDYCRKA